MTQVREPAVAGQFYPGKPAELRHEVEEFLSAGSAKASAKTGTPTSKLHALGIIAPHAGYVYSGAVAGAVYARIEVPRRVIVLCPNHTGLGEALSITSTGSYRTPLGEIPLDDAMGAALKAGFPLLREDALAQQREHAVEVQLDLQAVGQVLAGRVDDHVAAGHQVQLGVALEEEPARVGLQQRAQEGRDARGGEQERVGGGHGPQ